MRFFGSGWEWYVYLVGWGSSKSLNNSLERIDNTELTPRTSSSENWWTGNNSQTPTQVPPRYAWKSIKRSLHINLDKIEQHPDRYLPTWCMRNVLIHSIPLFISLLCFLQNECQHFFFVARKTSKTDKTACRTIEFRRKITHPTHENIQTLHLFHRRCAKSGSSAFVSISSWKAHAYLH